VFGGLIDLRCFSDAFWKRARTVRYPSVIQAKVLGKGGGVGEEITLPDAIGSAKEGAFAGSASRKCDFVSPHDAAHRPCSLTAFEKGRVLFGILLLFKQKF
jgi:hypothetical protein